MLSDQSSADRAHDWLVNLAHQHRVSPTQRRVIQYMLASLPDVAFASTIDVAEAAGVSQPTVTRLATALGYPGYLEFRSAIRDVVRGRTAPLNGVGVVPPTILECEQQNIGALERTVASDQMRRAVDLLAATQPLGIIGLRVSAALAEYLGYFARRVLPDVHVLSDAASMDDSVLQLHRNGATAVVAFVMPRYPAATVRALAQARALGMATVAIVDSPLVPFANDVDALLVAPVGADLVFDSHAAAVVLSISLLDALAARDPHRTQELLEAHEELVERWAHPPR
ncbi:MurR/RpiR family transcriptional regulator [Arthrobacter sp. H20]|uniref:MurR/RpiR family transcriptional regulator n=1 Tax=Arthrobacter sp. H20 TaxID=1267981 RepID=UPI000478726D|nr:MurR/RpiR family transcriptional regulator [Arthrobacter sp. H20]